MVPLVEWSCIEGCPLHRRNRKIDANLSTLTQMAISFSALPQEKRETEFDREGNADGIKGDYSLAIHRKCNHTSISRCESLNSLNQRSLHQKPQHKIRETDLEG